MCLFFDLAAPESSNREKSEADKRESSGGGDGGGGGSSGKPPGDDWWKNLFDNPQQIVIAVAIAAGAALFLMFSGMETREINWQEFRTKYLERGEVSLYIKYVENGRIVHFTLTQKCKEEPKLQSCLVSRC